MKHYPSFRKLCSLTCFSFSKIMLFLLANILLLFATIRVPHILHAPFLVLCLYLFLRCVKFNDFINLKQDTFLASQCIPICLIIVYAHNIDYRMVNTLVLSPNLQEHWIATMWLKRDLYIFVFSFSRWRLNAQMTHFGDFTNKFDNSQISKSVTINKSILFSNLCP